MRALVYDGTATALTTSRPDPVLAPGDAEVRTLLAGVSRIETAIARGAGDFRGVLGHQFVGQVVRVEDPKRQDLVGRRVVGSIATACGACDLCQSGLSEHCRDGTLLGIRGRDGCLADRFALPARNLVPVPDDVDDDRAVFADPVARAIQAVRRLTIEGKPYITVLGDDPLGLIMVQVMARLNASVRMVGSVGERLARCEKWGIKHRHEQDVGRRADQDVVVEATGTAEGLALALRLVRPRGTIVLTRLLPGDGDVDLGPIVASELTVVGCHRGPIAEAILRLAQGAVDVVSLIGRRMTLDDGADVLRAAADPEALRVVVRVADAT